MFELELTLLSLENTLQKETQILIYQIEKLNLVRLDTHPSTHLLIVSCGMKLVIGYGVEPFYKTGIDCQSLLVGHNLGNSNYCEVGLFYRRGENIYDGNYQQ